MSKVVKGGWLCAVSKDAGLRAAVERYEDMDLSFSGSREDNLLKVRDLE